eukprot:3614193-Pleurochrysis_carterae.AAC.6
MFRAKLNARSKPQVPSGKPRLCRGCDGCDVEASTMKAASRGCRFGEDHSVRVGDVSARVGESHEACAARSGVRWSRVSEACGLLVWRRSVVAKVSGGCVGHREVESDGACGEKACGSDNEKEAPLMYGLTVDMQMVRGRKASRSSIAWRMCSATEAVQKAVDCQLGGGGSVDSS